MNIMVDKINELCDIINEIQNPCRDPEVYRIMKEKDAIIGKHIGEKQRLQDELDRTRKALDVAKDVLKRIDKTRSGVKENLHATNGKTLNAGNGFCWVTIDDIHNALEQITALEQGGK